MGAFSIITERTANLANDISGYHSRMGGFLSEINEASLIIANETSLNIGVSINRVVEAFERDQENLFIMQSALERIIQRYISAENKNSRKAGGSENGQNNGGTADSEEYRYHRENGWKGRKDTDNTSVSNSADAEDDNKDIESIIPPSSPERDQEILDEINERFERFKWRYENINWTHKCPALVYWQLYELGLVSESDSSFSQGKDYARGFAEWVNTGTGYETKGYECEGEDAGEILRQIISENGGIVENIVVSFSSGNGLGSDGHVMLISKIENGKVYFIDNTKYSNGPNGREATVMSLEEYIEKYLDKWNCNCMTTVY